MRARMILDDVLACSFVGAPATIARDLRAFLAYTNADELMVVSAIYDHDARRRSYEILADVRDDAS